jgi:hypothetical protein
VKQSDESAESVIDAYPQHTALVALGDRKEQIGNFLDWLKENYVICDAMEPSDANDHQYYAYAHQSTEQIMADYFGIDLDALSNEKDKMYAEIAADVKAKADAECAARSGDVSRETTA